MSALEETEDRLPGLRFHVISSDLKKSSGGVLQYGTIVIRCEVFDRELWNMAVERLDGFKLFSSTTEELLSALGSELTHTDTQLQESLDREKELNADIGAKEAEIARLRAILHDIEVDFGVAD